MLNVFIITFSLKRMSSHLDDVFLVTAFIAGIITLPVISSIIYMSMMPPAMNRARCRLGLLLQMLAISINVGIVIICLIGLYVLIFAAEFSASKYMKFSSIFHYKYSDCLLYGRKDRVSRKTQIKSIYIKLQNTQKKRIFTIKNIFFITDCM